MKVTTKIRVLAMGVFCIALAPAMFAQTYTRIHGFNLTDGQHPTGLVQGTDGNLYGTTEFGGNGYGTIFRITPRGQLTTIYTFPNGAYPVGTLIQSNDGNFYGTTAGGGTAGFGSVFKITPKGALTTLYSFCSQGYPNCPDGYGPFAGLVRASNGAFYGTAQSGGAVPECGTIFKITSSGNLTTLHSFNDTDGCFPVTPLIQASDGNLYGTTPSGSAGIFRISLNGTFTTVYKFCSLSNCSDGESPEAGLIQGTDGNFYGTTNDQGKSGNGTVFKITPTGTLTTLHRFCATGCADGAYPATPLVQASDGNFYGTTTDYGTGGGTVFEITPDGDLTTLYSFCAGGRGCLDGDAPDALILDTNGTFYGTTVSGGLPGSCSSFGCGVVFSLATGLSPFVETLPVSGKVGQSVAILGTNLTGATAVTFNQTPATFTVKSSSQILATVPVGATTGTLQVVTLAGTLSSNVSFRVTP